MTAKKGHVDVTAKIGNVFWDETHEMSFMFFKSWRMRQDLSEKDIANM